MNRKHLNIINKLIIDQIWQGAIDMLGNPVVTLDGKLHYPHQLLFDIDPLQHEPSSGNRLSMDPAEWQPLAETPDESME